MVLEFLLRHHARTGSAEALEQVRGTPGSDRLRRSLAVEAMTCGPDAFNSGADLIVLEPGILWSASWGVRARLG